jgi:hypothetical protein
MNKLFEQPVHWNTVSGSTQNLHFSTKQSNTSECKCKFLGAKKDFNWTKGKVIDFEK